MRKMHFRKVPVYVVTRLTGKSITVKIHDDKLTEKIIPLSVIRSNIAEIVDVGDEDFELEVDDWFYDKEIAK